MRTLELHAHLKPIQRSQGRSSVAAAAYRAGIEIYDERTGIKHDYTRKQGVEHSQIYAPDHAPEWTHDRAKLWNACERKENRAKSCTAYEYEVGFIAEFNHEQRREVGDKIARELIERYDCVVDIGYHEPNKDGDQRNYHAHIMFTSRGLDAESKDGWKRSKIKELRLDKIEVDGEKTTVGAQELKNMRAFIANTMNELAERENIQVRVEHLSLKERGIDREPEPKMGAHATQMERSGQESRIGSEAREVWKRNIEKAYYSDRAQSLELETAQAQAEQTKRDIAKQLYDQQRAEMEEEQRKQQEKIAELTAQLHEKSRLALLWEKLRGRLAWNAQRELEAARLAEQENKERQAALEVARLYQEQQQQEAAERAYIEPEPLYNQQEENISYDSESEQTNSYDYEDYFKDEQAIREYSAQLRRERNAIDTSGLDMEIAPPDNSPEIE